MFLAPRSVHLSAYPILSTWLSYAKLYRRSWADATKKNLLSGNLWSLENYFHQKMRHVIIELVPWPAEDRRIPPALSARPQDITSLAPPLLRLGQGAYIPPGFQGERNTIPLNRHFVWCSQARCSVKFALDLIPTITVLLFDFSFFFFFLVEPQKLH